METPLAKYITPQPRPDRGEALPDNAVEAPKFDPAQFPDDTLIPTKSALEWTHHPKRTLEKWRVEGRGPNFIRCERSVRYRVGDIRRWLAGNTRGETRPVSKGPETPRKSY